MQPGDQQRVDGGAGRVGLIRGILVIVTAVAIGAFVISSGLDDSRTDVVAAGEDVVVGDQAESTPSSDPDAAASDAVDPAGAQAESGSTTETTVPGTDDSMTDDSMGDTSTTTGPVGPEVLPPGDVQVLVLNGAGAKGVAGRGSEILKTAGYGVLAPKNADFLGPSQVLYTEGFELEAAAVAEAFGVDPVAVVTPLDPNDKPINDTQDANIVVVVGEDGLINV